MLNLAKRSLFGLLVWQWALLALHFALYLRWMESSVFLGDDGIWLGRVQRFANHLSSPPSLIHPGTTKSIERHPFVVVYLHLLFYFIWPSVKAILIGVSITHIIAQAILFRAGNVLHRPWLGLLLVLFYFWTPSVQIFFALRTWQMVYLPLALSIFLYQLARYLEEPETKRIFFMTLACSVASYFHATSIMLLSVPLILLYFNHKPISLLSYSASASLVTVILLPWLLPLFQLHGVGALVFFFTALFLPWALHRWVKVPEVAVAYAAWACLIGLLLTSRVSLASLQYFFDTIGGNTSFFARTVGLSQPRWLGSYWLSLPVLLWCFALLNLAARFKKLDVWGRALFWLNTIPLLGVMIGHHFFSYPMFHHFLFLAPGAWLLLAYFLAIEGTLLVPSFPKKTIATMLVIFLLVQTVFARSHTTTSGEFGPCCASLGSKYRVVDLVRSRVKNPKLVPLPFDEKAGWCLNAGAWEPLLSERAISEREYPIELGYLHLFEPSARGHDPKRFKNMSQLQIIESGRAGPVHWFITRLAKVEPTKLPRGKI